MRISLCLLVPLVFGCLTAEAFQTADHSDITFEAASIKPVDAPLGDPAGRGGARLATFRLWRREGGPGTNDPARIHYTQMLSGLLQEAFEIPLRQLRAPYWMNEAMFDIDAVLNPGATVPEARLMLRNLLLQRFQISYHVESVPVDGFALVIDKKGAAITRVADFHGVSNAPLTYTPDGHALPQMTGHAGIRSVAENRGWVVAFEQQSMAQFAAYLAERFSEPVMDLTGTSEPYNFILQFFPPDWGIPKGDSGVKYFPRLTSVMRTNLGLKLEHKKQPGSLIVIDRAQETPTEN